MNTRVEACPRWFQDWRGQTAVLVASGPSASDVPVEMARGRARFIAVNNSWRLAPWADILFACDVSWWRHARGAPEFVGLKLSTDQIAAREFEDVHKVGIKRGDDRLELAEMGTVGWGGNSGFHALNLAVQFGAAKIILVGYDMTVSYGEHWHGRHPDGMHNPTPGNVARWRRAVDAAAKVIPDGIRVFNCSPISALQNYPKVTFEEAMAA